MNGSGVTAKLGTWVWQRQPLRGDLRLLSPCRAAFPLLTRVLGAGSGLRGTAGRVAGEEIVAKQGGRG